MPLQPDDTLFNGKFRVIRQLGRGGFGFVYLAEDTLLREQVAIKELIPALVGDEVALKRFLAEAKATIRLRHERLVGTHDVFIERGNYYIAMEYMPGGSLEARLKEHGALPVDEAVHVAADVAEGLAYAHARGIVHCDLKPANILFTADGHAKIADFGIAHVSDQMLSRSWLTPAGFVAGTLPYMSPEQVDGVRDEPRADLYALGAVMYRMLTGRTYLEFEEVDSPRAQARNVQRIEAEQPQPPSIHNRHIPPWLDQVVLKVLAKRPEDRYANANELLAMLARRGTAAAPASPLAAAAETVVVSPQPRPMPAVPPRPNVQPAPLPRWLWPAVSGIAVLLVVTVVALIAAYNNRQVSPAAAQAAG
jgi:serine/threonine-protein kinase